MPDGHESEFDYDKKHATHDRQNSKSSFAILEDKILYEKINEYINQYNTLPTQEALAIELDKSSIKDEEFQNSLKLLESITNENDEANRFGAFQWLCSLCKMHHPPS